MRVLVTGGAGFIGSYVVQHLVAEGHTVGVADRFTYAGKARHVRRVLTDIDLLVGDLSTGDLAERCAAWAPEYVVHMAAETHVDRAITHPESFMVSNALGTTRLLQALTHKSAVHKIVVYSTDEVYGPTPPGERFTEGAPFRPSNAYSASKVAVEGIAHAFWVTHGLPIVVLRPCNTYGPRQHPEKVIPKFVGQALRDEPLTLYNDGGGARDWLYATDHAVATQCLLAHGVPGEAYNLAAAQEYSDLEIAERVLLRVGKGEIMYTPGRPGHDRRYAMDGSKLRALGWMPFIPFSVGFTETVTWCMHSQETFWQDDVVNYCP